MKQHYVYLLTDDKMNYIGARTCTGRVDADSKYLGSSKHIPSEFKQRCNKIILARFKTRKEAIAYEIELHNKFDVANNEQFYNKAKQTSTGFDTTGTTLSNADKKKKSEFFKSLARTEEHNKKISESNKGKVLSEETRNKISKAKTGKPSPMKGKSVGAGIPKSEEHKKKIGIANKGKKRTKEQCEMFSRIRKGKPAPYSKTRYENIECPHCGKVGMKANMKRYHFDNCKEVVCQ